jgi:long-chain acyl-CoA synthetase
MSNPALSLVHGPSEPALFDLTIGQLADQQAAKYEDKDCIVIGWNNTRLSYRELSESSKVIARGLLALGVQSGDRIAILSGDDERFVQVFFAAARIGACLVIINKTYTVPECLRALKHTGEDCQTNIYSFPSHQANFASQTL